MSDDGLLDRFPFSFQITTSLLLASDKSVIGLKAKLHNAQFRYPCMLSHYDLSCNSYQKQTICS